MAQEQLHFASDYQEGAHPRILQRLIDTNLMQTPGYGTDEICESARARIREACAAPQAAVHFLTGGTQTNAIVIKAVLQPYQGVVSAVSGHVSVHEAGAIEAGGHKVMTISSESGKISAAAVEQFVADYEGDDNKAHMVMPGMVYLSQPNEFGVLYSLEELTAISDVCRRHHLPLFLDGARLAYALACPENDVSLADIARLCDVFYIGGTKCGALLGEAVVLPNPDLIPHFFTIIKQNGALLAKGRVLGIQFDELFKDNLYAELCKTAIDCAHRIKAALQEAGLPLCFDSQTNQIFFIIDNEKMKKLGEKAVYNFGEKYDESHSIIRFCTSWATTVENTEKLCEIIKSL